MIKKILFLTCILLLAVQLTAESSHESDVDEVPIIKPGEEVYENPLLKDKKKKRKYTEIDPATYSNLINKTKTRSVRKKSHFKNNHTFNLTGFNIFYNYHLPEQTLLKKHFPNLAGIGAEFDYAFYRYFILYFKYNYTGLFNAMKDKPIPYSAGSLFLSYFHQGIKFHTHFFDKLDTYIQIGWNYLYYKESASTPNDSTFLKFDDSGFDYGVGVKYMFTPSLGFTLEGIYKHNSLGEDNMNFNSFNINAGIHLGVSQ